MKHLWFPLLLFLTLGGYLALMYVYHYHPETRLTSPLINIAKLKIDGNIWQPKSAEAYTGAPKITAEAAFFVDTKSGQVLYEKSAQEKLPIASLTKIMTVIVTLENKSYSDVMTVSQSAASMEPDRMELITGEKLTVEELLAGIFLVSANDGAEVLAQETTGDRSEFIKLMNQKANQLGMNNSLFINPTGLEEDYIDQHSTAYDVALMARYAIRKWPQLVDITSNPHIFQPQSATHQDYYLYNGINLLTTYPGVVGFKTGYTPEAGLTLVTLARKGDKEVLGVLLGATNRRDDAKLMLDYSFQKLGVPES